MPAKIKRPLTSPAWVTTEELAAWWGMNPKSIGNMIRDGRLPGKLIGGMYIIPANVKRPERRKKGRRPNDTMRQDPPAP